MKGTNNYKIIKGDKCYEIIDLITGTKVKNYATKKRCKTWVKVCGIEARETKIKQLEYIKKIMG